MPNQDQRSAMSHDATLALEVGGSLFRGTDRFRLSSLLGRGGAGVVYAAFDREQGSEVALKVLMHWTPEGIAHFKNEFRALQGLRHRNLVELRELLFEDEHWFLTMERVRGTDFLSYVRGSNSAQRFPSWSGVAEMSPDDETAQPWQSSHVPSRPAAETTPDFDEGRLRATFAQLAVGLSALHRAKKVHRDVKPSNVLVDLDGRVVIVDFGLVTEVDVGRDRPARALGTPRYMAPEQAAAKDVGPASDWYSAGVLLYEALTGRMPFPSPTDEPVAPRELNRGVPPDLSELSLRLLARDPAKRASEAEVLAHFQHELTGAGSELTPLGSVGEGHFVGRTRELGFLEAAFERSRSGIAQAVVIEGESGVGKTSLVQRFLEQARAREPRVQCFMGRCFERESLPYKAIDGLMDAVCAELGQRPKAELARLLPDGAALIARAFPVLGKLDGLRSPHGDLGPIEPHQERLRVFSALRELFVRLAAERPMLIVLDDMQWSDLDSLALLSGLLKPPGAPQLLLIAAKRPGGPLERMPFPGEVSHLELGNLSQQESSALIAELIGSNERPEARERVQALAHEAQGHPLFLRELALRFELSPAESRGPTRLDDALWERISTLADSARRLLELTAIAGRPTAQSTIAHAVELSLSAPADLGRHLTELRHACLLRTTGSHPSDTVEPYHDRIREAVLARLEPNVRELSHRVLARALMQSPAPDAEALAIHWLGAAEPDKAHEYTVLAASQSESALAFERAARLYRQALELGQLADPRRRELTSRLADALANAGRGLEAAEAYRAAGDGDDSLVGLRHQRLAAEQLLRSGRIELGVEAVRKVLHKLGLESPRSSLGALASLLALRARISLRGFGYDARDEAQVTPLESARIDGLWMAATCLTMFDNTRSAELQCRGILRALNTGTRSQVLRAHTAEAIFLGTAGRPQQRAIERVLGAAGELAAELRDPYALGWVNLSRGATAFLLGDWPAGEEQCATAEAIFQRRSGALWELGSARAFGTWSAMMRGKFAAVSERVPRYVEEAEARGDLYAATMQMTGFSNAAWLSKDDVATARRMLALAEQRWPGANFDVPRYLNMVAAACIELYVGAGRAAHARVLKDWRSLRWGIPFRAQITRFGMRTVRGLSALAAFDEHPTQRLLNDASACARGIAAERITWSEAFAHMIFAGVAQRRGDLASALEHLGTAEHKALQSGMLLHHAVVRQRRGEIIGGDAGQALIEETRQFMANEGVVRPGALADMLTARFPRRH